MIRPFRAMNRVRTMRLGAALLAVIGGSAAAIVVSDRVSSPGLSAPSMTPTEPATAVAHFMSTKSTEAADRPLAGFADPRIVEACDRGLSYLAATQDKETGGWRQDVGYKYNERYDVVVEDRPHVGVTSLALMAFLSGGHIPGRGRFGDVVARGTDYVLSCVDQDTGYISANETRMYSHAFACLFLAEIYGMTHRADVQAKLQQAIDLTVKSQNRPAPRRGRPHAPKSTIDRAYDDIDRSAIKTGRYRGAFKYQIDQGGARHSFALTSAGLASLFNSGFYDDPMVAPAIDWLKKNMRIFGSQERYRTYFYWYGHYYCAQVMFIASDQDRSLWDEFYWPSISRELLDHQQSDGSWPNSPGPGEGFGTAVAAIILQVPNPYLPIFQR